MRRSRIGRDLALSLRIGNIAFRAFPIFQKCRCVLFDFRWTFVSGERSLREIRDEMPSMGNTRGVDFRRFVRRDRAIVPSSCDSGGICYNFRR